MSKYYYAAIIIILAVAVISTAICLAPAWAIFDPWGGLQPEINAQLGLGNLDPRLVIARIINIILGFLGIVALLIILLAGFKWMASGGSEEKVGMAKKMLISGIIGLVIIFLSWSLATYLINNLFAATGSV